MQKKLIIIAETIENQIAQSYKELLGFGASLSSDDGSQLLFVIPGQKVTALAEQISLENNIHTLAIEHDDLTFPNPDLLLKILPEIIAKYTPEYICMTHSVRSSQLAASLSMVINAACITGVESCETQNGYPIFTRMMFNGKLVGKTSLKANQALLTIIPGAFPDSFTPNHTKDSVRTEIIKVNQPSSGFKPKKIFETIPKDNQLEEADVIVSAGMGIESEENIDLIQNIVSIFPNAAIAGSRIVCDHGWLPYACQIGETGKQVSPKLYIACGISGTMQHTAGMKKSNCIIAINTDPNAPIFSITDYGVVEDLKSFLPILAAKYYNQYCKK
jgi:electron transfer flavoprotein alpha subunit